MFCLYIYPPPATGCVFTEIRGYFHTKHHKNSRLPPSLCYCSPLVQSGWVSTVSSVPWSPTLGCLWAPSPVFTRDPTCNICHSGCHTSQISSWQVTWEHHTVWQIPRDEIRCSGEDSGYQARVRTDPSRCELCHLDFRVRYNIGTILSLSADYNLLKTNLSDTEEAGGDRFNYRPQGPYCEQRSWNIKYLHLSVLYFHHFLFSALLWWAGGVSKLGC